MTVNWVFFLEEPSAQDFLAGYLGRFDLRNVEIHLQVFEGKQDLEKQLTRRIQYWQKPNSKFMVMRDQDSGNCVDIKNRLTTLCVAGHKSDVVVRVACRELETFFVGDWTAVAEAYQKSSLASRSRQAKYRTPDALGSPSRELKDALGTYSKRDGARKISPKINPDRNKSKSFHAVNRTLLSWISEMTP